MSLMHDYGFLLEVQTTPACCHVLTLLPLGVGSTGSWLHVPKSLLQLQSLYSDKPISLFSPSIAFPCKRLSSYAQAWSEWLSNAAAVFEMVDWSGNGAVTHGGHDFADESTGLPGLIEEFTSGKAWTKTTSLEVDQALGDARVGKGFERIYRSYDMTPGNTLSLQVLGPVCLCC